MIPNTETRKPITVRPRCLWPDCRNRGERRGYCARHFLCLQAVGKLPAPKPQVHGRAARVRNWTTAEYDFLKNAYGHSSITGIARRLGRSFNAVRTKVIRLGLNRHACRGTLSATAVAYMFRVDNHEVIMQWRRAGLHMMRLPRGDARDPRNRWAIGLDELRRFLAARPEAVDPGRAGANDRVLLGLTDLPPRPRAKVLRCRPCQHEWSAPLDESPRNATPNCPRCGRRVSRWAVRYADRPDPFPAPRVRPTREQSPYYDPASDRLRCLVCGHLYKNIASHVPTHGFASVAAYFTAHGLPPNSPCACRATGQKIRFNWGKTKGVLA